MLQLNAVETRTLDLLKRLTNEPLLSNYRLVGGTALALQIGHRLSIDLDFFSDTKNNLEEIEYHFESLQESVLNAKTSYALFYMIENIKVDVLNYPSSFLFSPILEDGIRLASIKDIAAMKLKTVMNRGSKKDFYDIYFLLKEFSLEEMVALFHSKYKNYDLIALYKSLNYFVDAEDDIEPVLLREKNITWEQIKTEITKQTKYFFK